MLINNPVGFFILLYGLVVSTASAVGLGQPLATAEKDYRVKDATGQLITLEKPAQRIITLSPHSVENVYSAGGFEKIVATSTYSTYPPQAKQLPIIGSYQTFDYERIASFQPDLVVAWQSGNGSKVIQQLRDLGITVYAGDNQVLSDVAESIRDLGKLMGTSDYAEPIAQQFMAKLQLLSTSYRHKDKVTAFYQVWHQPLQTLSKESMVSQIIDLCGGTNIYADAVGVAPIISIESLLVENPDVIIGSQGDGVGSQWQDFWRQQWPQLQAVANNQLIDLPSDQSRRPTVRILEAAQILCERLEAFRQQSSK